MSAVSFPPCFLWKLDCALGSYVVEKGFAD